VKRYGYFRDQFHRALDEIASIRPDAVVLIDYPGFNLRLARALRQKSSALKIIYYISPQVWAWNRGRISQMARVLDLMLCIFPFEAELYNKSGLRTVFVGHPMIENFAGLQKEERQPDMVGLFPGSRLREVRKIFPVMLEAASNIVTERERTRFEVAAASESLATRSSRPRRFPPPTPFLIRSASPSLRRGCCGIICLRSAMNAAGFWTLGPGPFCPVLDPATGPCFGPSTSRRN
jgi:lipid-A-disaccharide synthase